MANVESGTVRGEQSRARTGPGEAVRRFAIAAREFSAENYFDLTLRRNASGLILLRPERVIRARCGSLQCLDAELLFGPPNLFRSGPRIASARGAAGTQIPRVWRPFSLNMRS